MVLDWIANGVPLPFTSKPAAYEFSNHFLTPKERCFVLAEIKKLKHSGAISTVHNRPHCVNAIGCVPKKGNKFRLICDLRPANEYISCPYFKHEGIDTVSEIIRPVIHS